MGKKEILDKLSNKFETIPDSEEDAVYILSRVRKILELDNYPEKYVVLNFYCNLALHSKISRPPKKISDMLENIRTGSDYSNSIIGFNNLHQQLKDFIIEHNFPNFYLNASFNDIQHFNRVLNSIYSHTPIITEVVTRYQTIVYEDGSIGGSIIK